MLATSYKSWARLRTGLLWTWRNLGVCVNSSQQASEQCLIPLPPSSVIPELNVGNVDAVIVSYRNIPA